MASTRLPIASPIIRVLIYVQLALLQLAGHETSAGALSASLDMQLRAQRENAFSAQQHFQLCNSRQKAELHCEAQNETCLAHHFCDRPPCAASVQTFCSTNESASVFLSRSLRATVTRGTVKKVLRRTSSRRVDKQVYGQNSQIRSLHTVIDALIKPDKTGDRQESDNCSMCHNLTSPGPLSVKTLCTNDYAFAGTLTSVTLPQLAFQISVVYRVGHRPIAGAPVTTLVHLNFSSDKAFVRRCHCSEIVPTLKVNETYLVIGKERHSPPHHVLEPGCVMMRFTEFFKQRMNTLTRRCFRPRWLKRQLRRQEASDWLSDAQD